MKHMWDIHSTIFFTLVASTVCVNFEVTPKNVAAKTGERIEFSCTHSGNFKGWVEYITSNTPGTLTRIALNGALTDVPRKNSYDISENNDLIIKSVKKEDAGRYGCEDLESSEVSMAFVLYLASDPSCSHNISDPVEAGTVVGVTCQVEYSSDRPGAVSTWAPVVEFSDQNDNLIDESTPGKMKYTLHYEVETGDSGKTIEAKTKFPAPPSDVFVLPPESNTVVYARNAPDYTFTYNDAVFGVIHYGPTNLHFNASGEVYIGSVLSCKAEAMPETITFKIFNKTKDNIIVVANSIEITADMLGEQTIGCIATNYILGNHERTVEIQETFTVAEVRKANVKGILIGVGVALLIILIIIFICCKCYQNKKHDDALNQTEDDEEKQLEIPLQKQNEDRKNNENKEENENEAPEDDQHDDDPKKRNAENLNYADLNLPNRPKRKAPEIPNNFESVTYAQVQRT